MGKIFGILMLVIGVWIGMEIFTKGTEAAFGGLLAMGGGPVHEVPGQPHRTPVQRIGARVQEQINAGSVRSTGGFGDESPDEVVDEGDEP
jgi:hypothetical protein